METIRLTKTEREKLNSPEGRRRRRACELALERLIRAEVALRRNDSDKNNLRINDELAWLEETAGRLAHWVKQ